SSTASGPWANRPPHILLLINCPFTALLGRFPQKMPKTPKKPVSIARKLAIFAIFGVFAGFAWVYLTNGGLGNGGATICSADRSVTDRLKPLARGEVAAVLVPDQPRKLPELSFRDGEGNPRTLKDFSGKTVLLNLWATWCA